VSDETLVLLRSRIGSPLDESADPRPLACLIAAEVGATELAGLVVGLTTNPHPLVAAVARAAALRLGADVRRVGSLDELAEFLPDADLDQLRAWSNDQGKSSRSS
jgi:hypothetical protein